MLRPAILFGVAWPFVVAIVIGAALAKVDIGEPIVKTLLASTFVVVPAIVGGLYRVMPIGWPMLMRAVLSVGLAYPLVIAELWVACQVVVGTYMGFGGSVDI